jgi:iron complex outermembrane receptor protein
MVMTYASVSTGFKGGGTNARPFGPGQVVPFDKETLQAFELGAKTDFFERRLRVNVSAFLNKYEDIQITLLECPSLTPVAPCAATFNAGDADIQGWEVELEAHPIENLTIDATFSDLDFEYTRLLTNSRGANITGLTLGQTAPGTVETKWSVGMQYDLRLANGARISPRFDYSFQGGFNTNAVFNASNRVAGFHLGDVRLTYAAADDSWEAALVGRNVFDDRYFISNFDLLTSSGSQYGLLGQPREVSIVFKKKF